MLLLTPSAAFERRLRTEVPELAGNGLRRLKEQYLAMDAASLGNKLAEHGVQVVCIGPEVPPDRMLELARMFDREYPDVCVVLVGEPTEELRQSAMRAGVRDVLAPATDPAEVHRALLDAQEIAERRRSPRAAATATSAGSSTVVTVLSAKGGSGKTMVATNLALTLATKGAASVALVDLDVHFGDVTSALSLDPDHTLADAAACPSLDKTVLKIYLTRHPSGVYVLAAPSSPGQGDDVTPEVVTEVLRLLSEEFTIVVIDTAAGLDEITLAAVESATDLVLVCSTDVASVRCLRKEIDALDTLALTSAKRHFLLNRAGAKVGLEVADIEAVVGMAADVTVPSANAVPTSMNLGTAVIESAPRSPVARELTRLAGRFGDVGRTKGPLGRLMERWTGGRA